MVSADCSARTRACARSTGWNSIDSASNNPNACSNASRSSGAARIFLRHALATSNVSKLGACNETLRRRGRTSSRVRSSNNSATIAEASTILAIAVVADQPRRLVPALEAERADSRRDLLDRKLARRHPGRLLEERAQFALQRAM